MDRVRMKQLKFTGSKFSPESIRAMRWPQLPHEDSDSAPDVNDSWAGKWTQ